MSMFPPQILPDIHAVDDGGLVWFYILPTRTETLCIDSGTGAIRPQGEWPGLFAGSSRVINTHAHPDHFFGNIYFDDVAMTEREWARAAWWREEIALALAGEPAEPVLRFIQNHCEACDGLDWEAFLRRQLSHEPTRRTTLRPGDRIEADPFALEVLATPAHVEGAICLLDRRRRVLFTGDTVASGQIWLHLETSAEPATSLATYEALGELADDVDWILPAHGRGPLPGAMLGQLAEGVRRVRVGHVRPRRVRTFMGAGVAYDVGPATLVFRRPVEASGETDEG